MPVDEGDDERWAELPGGGRSDEGTSSSDAGGEDVVGIDHISSLSADDGAAGTLLYQLPLPSPDGRRRTLRISHDSTKGLAARVWPSAAMLVDFVAAEVEREREGERQKDEKGDAAFSWRGASVLELGSGPGLAGIAVAALAGSRVLLTDLEGPALTLARRNVEENAAEIEKGGGSVAVAALPWGERGGAQRAAEAVSDTWCFASPPTAVVAADVIYDGALFAPLLETLEELAFAGGRGSSDGGGGGGDDNGNGASRAPPSSSSPPSLSSHSPPSPPQPPRILIAHVRRWKRDARFWAAARKRFEVIDVTHPGTRRRGGGRGGEGEGEGASEIGGGGGKRYSSHEKGALRVFELVPKIPKSRQ